MKSIIIILIVMLILTLASCLPPPESFEPVCGNDILEEGEECDDGSLNGISCNPPEDGNCTYCGSDCNNVTLSNFQNPPDELDQGFFKEQNTWYTKIPEGHPLSPRSNEHIQDILINSQRMYANYREWSVPIWYADEDTPYITVEVLGTRYKEIAESLGWNNVPIPPEALPAANKLALEGKYHDGHMVVISHDGKYSWEFFRAVKHPDGRWTTSNVRRWDLNSDGVNQPYDKLGDVRACPTSLLHGLVTYEEIKQGRIDHALTFSYWGEKKANHWSIYPCESYRAGISERSGAMLLGERLQLDPDLDLDTLGLTHEEKIVARALQEYGMVFVENCAVGCNSIYFESLEDKPESWGNILPDLRKIPLDKFRVVEPVMP